MSEQQNKPNGRKKKNIFGEDDTDPALREADLAPDYHRDEERRQQKQRNLIDTSKNNQDEYIDEFKSQLIEMSDFTIQVRNLPPDLAYGDNEHILRAKLWEHFQTLAAMGS